MPLDALFSLEIIEAMEGFLQRKRPPLHIRPQLDIDYTIENQSITIFEVRPKWRQPEVIEHLPVAKATYVKTAKHWKVFWMRASGNWEAYPPQRTVKSVIAFAKLVEEDKHHCFWG